MRRGGKNAERETAGIAFSDPGRVVLPSEGEDYSRVISGFPAVIAIITPRPAAITNAMATHAADTR